MSRAGYLLDTNVVSETRKRQPHAGVVEVLRSIASNRVFISVITLGELRRGVAAKRRSDPVAASAIERWVDELQSRYLDQLLPVDVAVANLWGELTSPGGVPVIDALIAATTIQHDLAVVTRNVHDYGRFEVDLVDPWAKSAPAREPGP